MPAPRFLALSGGVGGAKLALGLAHELAPSELLVAVNTGDDFDHLGLRICPDLDTLLYTLSGRYHREQGWGRQEESWHCMDALAELGGDTWFRLGDRDLATHLFRTRLLQSGSSLSDVTARLFTALGVRHPVVPISDDPLATVVLTPEGELPFQHYFVRQQCAPAVTGFRFEGAGEARIQHEVASSLASGELEGVIVCPSNPFVSVGPMLAVAGLREALRASGAPVVAVSPIVGGQAIKGPTAKMMGELSLPSTALAIATHYHGLLDGLVIDEQDAAQADEIRALGMQVCVAPTVMRTDTDKRQLARAVVDFAKTLESR